MTNTTNHSSDPVDIFFITLPWWDNMLPPCAPPVLKGIVESQGYRMKTYDSHIDLEHKFCKNDKNLYYELETYFITADKNNRHINLINEFYDYVIEKILNQPCRFVAFSVFSVHTHRAAFDILPRLKAKTDVPVIVGGRGLSTRSWLAVLDDVRPREQISNFSDVIRDRKWADHIIIGDGEDALLDVLKGQYSESDQAVHHVAKSKNLEYPFSNFDDFDLTKYSGILGRIQLPVISSKGCVRSCDFCDVAAQMVRFQSKNGARLAEEMIFLAEKYNIHEFALTDSIANGNMKSLRETCEALKTYNQNKDPSSRIRWSGNWISRPPEAIKPEFYDLLADSGCESFNIGAESGSNRVLEAMNKKTVVEGLYYDIEHFHRVKTINANFNNILGHWAEEFPDFLDTVNMILRLGQYFANRTVVGIHMSTFSALDKTPAVDQHHSGIMRHTDNFTQLWYSKKNPKSTLKIRFARYIALAEICLKLRIPVEQLPSRVKIWLSIFKNKDSNDEWNSFFEKNIDPDTFEVCQDSLNYLEDNWTYVESQLKTMYPKLAFRLEVTASHCNGAPTMFVRYDGKTLYNQPLPEGKNTVEFEVEYTQDQLANLEIGMIGKDKFDTEVDQEGNILRDKNIRLDSLIIDKIDVVKNPEFFYNNLEYYEDDVLQSRSKPGFFSDNSRLKISFMPPFWRHYLLFEPNHANYLPGHDIEKTQVMINEMKNLILKLKY